jgi:hypothetical protein
MSSCPVETTRLQYPPNSLGWNAANHSNPMLEVLFFLEEMKNMRSQIRNLESLLYR